MGCASEFGGDGFHWIRSRLEPLGTNLLGVCSTPAATRPYVCRTVQKCLAGPECDTEELLLALGVPHGTVEHVNYTCSGGRNAPTPGTEAWIL